MPRRMLVALCVLPGLLSLGLSCKKTDESPQAPVADRDTPEEYKEFEPPPMAVHYLKANEVHDAVVHGNLDVAQATARWISENTKAEEMPMKWRNNVPPVIASANAVVGAKSLQDAAKGLADMGNACGKCHAEMGIGIELSAKEPPPAGDDTSSHMKRHEWGVKRMWDGLIAPSDESWKAGADVLREAPLEVHSDSPDAQKEGQGIADQVHGLGSAALDQTVPDERAMTYADLIYTCSKCHSGGG